VCEDLTSFVSPRIVSQLHDRGRAVLGLHDPGDEAGEQRLWELGVDAVLSTDTGPETILGHVATLAIATSDLDEELRRLVAPPAPDEPTDDEPRGDLVVVGGPPGGPGVTETALGLAGRWSTTRRTLLADLDTVAPAVSQRLALPLEPNLLTVVEQFEQGLPARAGLHELGRLSVCTGLVDPRDWREVRPETLTSLVDRLRTRYAVLVADVGHRLEAEPDGQGQRGRYEAVRGVVAAADVVVGVVAPNPVGAARLLEWIADVRAITSAPLHVVVNGALDRERFACREIERELCRAAAVQGTWIVPFDRSVTRAAWDGRLARGRRHRRRLAHIAKALQSGTV
jgi:hypothetical protein